MTPHTAPVPTLVATAAAATLALGLAVLPSAAQAQPGRAAALASRYTCTSSYGSGTTDVGVRTDLPASVRKKVTVTARGVRIAIVLPEQLVTTLRDSGATSVSGSVTKAALAAGSKRVALGTLTVPATPVPASGPMTLVAAGRTSAFTVGRPGSYAVRIPSSFATHLVASAAAGSAAADLTCAVAPGAATKLATLVVRK